MTACPSVPLLPSAPEGGVLGPPGSATPAARAPRSRPPALASEVPAPVPVPLPAPAPLSAATSSGPVAPVWPPGAAEAVPPVVAVTAEPALAAGLERAAAAAGVALALLSPTQPLPAARLLLVGADVLRPTTGGPQACPGVLPVAAPGTGSVVVVAERADEHVWQAAAALAADGVAVLPEGAGRLAERMAAAATAGVPRAPVLGVMAGCGGAGASLLAASLAVEAAARDLLPILLDADPWGGGMDALLGSGAVPGLRWGDLAGVRGRLRAGALTAGLPLVDGVGVLSWEPSWPEAGASGVGPETLAAVIEAARVDAGAVTLDLPRRDDAATSEAVRRCDAVVLVVTAQVRAALAAAAAARWLLDSGCDVKLVVRATSTRSVSPSDVADALGLPLYAALRSEVALARLAERGEVSLASRRSAARRLAARIWQEQGGHLPAVTVPGGRRPAAAPSDTRESLGSGLPSGLGSPLGAAW